MTEKYTPGHTQIAVDFMAMRTLASHGQFLVAFLNDGASVLDCGFGPGTITCDIAESIPSGTVLGIDQDKSQVEQATQIAEARGIENVSFRQGSAYELQLEDSSFDTVLCHALLEHLKEPGRAIGELRRVLKPKGTLAVCSPEWGGFLLAPPSDELFAAIESYKALQTTNGGDVYIGRKFSRLYQEAGFENASMQTRYEVYESLESIGHYLAIQLEDAGEIAHGETLRRWAARPGGMFAQAWVSCTGQKPPGS